MPYGFWVFTIGLILAIVGAAKPSANVGDWPDTTMYFFIGATVAAIGVYLWRKGLKEALKNSIQHADNAGGSVQNVLSLFEKLKTELPIFAAKYAHFDAADLTDQTESFIDLYVAPIVELRYELMHRFGLALGAEIILEFSKAERLLNRVQTAAIDGDLNEAHRVFPQAESTFNSAMALLPRS